MILRGATLTPVSELATVEIADHVGVIRMRRAEKHNAFNRELSAAVAAAFDELAADPDVHVAVLTGSGSAFSAGADMSEAVAAIDEYGRNDGMAATVVRVAAFEKPLLAAVNGVAYGGGALLAITCDIRIACEAAAFRFPGAAYGLVVGGAQLPRVVGAPRAKELLFTGRVVGAEEALRIGLVDHLVPAAELDATVMAMARQIAANSPEALIATKRAVDRATQADDGQREEIEANKVLRRSPEHHARFRAAAERVARGNSKDTP